MRHAFVAGVALLVGAPLAAQQMRDYNYDRPHRGERQLRAVIEFAAGRLIARPGSGDRLYGLTMQYDAERFRPVGWYDAARAEVHLGVQSTGSGGFRVDSRSALPQLATIELPRSVDLALDVTIGAAEGTLDLGGLRLSALDVSTGASRTTIAFATPTEGSCRTASVTSGAGELTVAGMGNSRCRAWRFDGGVGPVKVDLGGAWTADSRLTFNMALGGVTVTAPKDLGLRVQVSGFLSGFDSKGFLKEASPEGRKEGKRFTSANYAKAAHHIDIEVSSALGGLTVVWK